MPFRPDAAQIDDMALEPETGFYPEEDQLLAKASQVDTLQDESMALAAPTGDFSQDALNDLVVALNGVLPLFGVDYDYPEFDMGVEGSLPTEFVSSLLMISQAATDSGLEHLAPDLAKVHDDDGLLQIGAQLDVLKAKPVFKAYLASAPKETPAPADEAVLPVDATEPQETAMNEAEIDNLFTARI